MTEKRFEKFFAAARRGRPAPASRVRLGFATRVVARWASSGREEDSLLLWLRFARWGAALALVAVLVAFLALPWWAEPIYLSGLAQPELASPRLF